MNDNTLLTQFANINPDPSLRWVARRSTRGLGLRLHQIDPTAGWGPGHATPQDAIEAFLVDEGRSLRRALAA